MRRRADVEVLGGAAQEQVTHASADQVRGVTELAQAVKNFQSLGLDLAAGDGVFGARNDGRLHWGQL